MQMISKGMYEAVYGPRKHLRIEPYEGQSFEVNCYYFRLGALSDGGRPVPLPRPVLLGKGQAQVVFSLERFTLDGRVFAILGPCSELLLKGFALHNSPTIDPGFDGVLEMRILNMGEEALNLEKGMRLGKVVFFDVSDTLMDLDTYIRTEKEKVAWVTRQRAADEMRKIADGLTVDEEGPGVKDIWVEKTIDSEWEESQRPSPFAPSRK